MAVTITSRDSDRISMRMNLFKQPTSLGKILVADGEPSVFELLGPSLAGAGFTVTTAANGKEALEKVRIEKPDLVLLDLVIPDISGLDVCKTLKSNPLTSKIPLIIVTAMATEVDRIVALEIGADDYVIKPFSTRELLLRIRAVLRRSQGENSSPQIKRIGALILDTGRYSVQFRGKPLRLTPIEFKLLEALIDNRGHLQSREVLLKTVWSSDALITIRTVDTHIQRLREKLGTAGSSIETVRGKGYKIIELSS